MKTKAKILTVLTALALGLFAADQAKNRFYCKHCGAIFTSIQSLTASSCQRHPAGPAKGRHVLYEGLERDEYVCKHCGYKAKSIRTLTAGKCLRHTNGPLKGSHEPAL